MPYLIRKYTPQDKAGVRRLSCETAFLGTGREQIFNDDEILADFLTMYFTDYEPDSCFVAVDRSTGIGYLIGSKDATCMNRVVKKRVVPALFVKAFYRKTFLKKTNLRFLLHCILSFLRGEFFLSDLSSEFPATLHINIDKDYRNQGMGRKLIAAYLDFLKEHGVRGVHFSTLSENAKGFFLKMGFDILYRKGRSYLKPYAGREVVLYVFGKKL